MKQLFQELKLLRNVKDNNLKNHC